MRVRFLPGGPFYLEKELGFADCKETAIRVSGELPESKIFYGMFTADPKKDWHPLWVKTTFGRTFTHFWVEKDNQIIDEAADQFGEENGIRPIDDPRYVKVGEYIPTGDTHIPVVSTPKIIWDTMTKPGGMVTVEWEDYYNYLSRLDK